MKANEANAGSRTNAGEPQSPGPCVHSPGKESGSTQTGQVPRCMTAVATPSEGQGNTNIKGKRGCLMDQNCKQGFRGIGNLSSGTGTRTERDLGNTACFRR